MLHTTRLKMRKNNDLRDIYDKRIIDMMDNKCECGEPLALSFAYLTQKNAGICKKYGKDNTPADLYNDDCR